MSTAKRLNNEQILSILSGYKNAIAIYTGDDIIIESANDAMISFWGKDRSVIGKSLGVALPEIKNQPFMGMLQAVMRTGIDDKGKAIKADLEVNGLLQTFYFDYEYIAIKDETGKTYAILHTATDVTDVVLGQEAIKKAKEQTLALEREQSLNEELAASYEELEKVKEHLDLLNIELERRVLERTLALSKSESRLRYLLSDAPIAIAVFQGRELIIESANKKVLEAWGKSSDIIGKPLHVALPELIGQSFLQILDDVYTTGIPFYGNEVKALLEQNGKIEEVYSNFVYQPLKDEEGVTRSIMLTANVITDQVVSKQNIQALNEELTVINEELNESQERIEHVNESLKLSEARLDQILSELPTPIVVLRGPKQEISLTNTAILNFWNKTREEVIGRPMLEVFPELTTQPFPGLWKKVLETGEPIINRERPVRFKRPDGSDRLFYVDYYYQVLLDSNGNHTSVLATVIDVTDKVVSRQQVEQAEAKLRLAIDSSELGTWHVDTVTREFTPSNRLKEIFGYYESDEMPYEAVTAQITDEFRVAVNRAIMDAIATGESYDMEFSITGFHDKQLRWVRATGKLYDSGTLTDSNFSGTVQDITQRKLEDQRKDDFLSIASHELKTPITTLKGSLQLLDRYKENLNHPVVPRLIEQSNGSVAKITGLIDDLLNTTRTNEGQLHLNKTHFNIAEMLNSCCNHIRIGGKHDLNLIGGAGLTIYADEQRIDQVVVNFVNNAAKYAPFSRDINLIIEELPEKIKVSVQDFGSGIPKEKIPHLFDRYYRADYGGTQYSGLGLGLYISAEIIKRHGGEIGVNTELNEGSTFWFTLPKL
ncbi:PAS domain-containing sensor histidine kinase [Pedobacter nototheniae]|uniref:PAS domain-containing sensor histidine kinase n=1 Tax=Pedobacter nototheniae TaxID=2488994 RepID=UPI00103C405C|nr:PAS domain-containing sensor histidine kinase [Pedobacter nototheniae]